MSPTLNSRTAAIATAAAREINDELTLILSSVSESLDYLEDDHVVCEFLLELEKAAQRCAKKAALLLSHSARLGTRPTAARLDQLVDDPTA